MKKMSYYIVFITFTVLLGIQSAFAQFHNIEKTKKELTVRNIYTIAETQNGDIFAGTWGAGIWKSTDIGNTWNRTSEGLQSYDIRKLIALNSGRIFAATVNGKSKIGHCYLKISLLYYSQKKVMNYPKLAA